MKANDITKTSDAAARFKVGDRVRVRNMPNMFYTRTQSYVRGVDRHDRGLHVQGPHSGGGRL